jgi:hypothetical protein
VEIVNACFGIGLKTPWSSLRGILVVHSSPTWQTWPLRCGGGYRFDIRDMGMPYFGEAAVMAVTASPFCITRGEASAIRDELLSSVASP